MPKMYKLTETTKQATHYYIVPPLQLAIPKTSDSREVLNAILLETKSFDLPSGLADYPIVKRDQLHTLFPTYKVLEVKVTYIKYKLRDKDEPENMISTAHLKLILSLKKD